MNAAQRAAKRHKRENRKDKGVCATAKRQAHAAAVRSARRRAGNIQGGDDSLVLLADSIMRGRHNNLG